MSYLNYTVTRLREIAHSYEQSAPLGWQEVQGIHKFIEHLEALPTMPAEPTMSPCPLCGMARAMHQPCPYCGC